jgi:hypothetical protein
MPAPLEDVRVATIKGGGALFGVEVGAGVRVEDDHAPRRVLHRRVQVHLEHLGD